MEPREPRPALPVMTPGEVFRARIVFQRDQAAGAHAARERAAVVCSLRSVLAVYVLGLVYLVLALLGAAPVPHV